jgi:hypothetical protein
MIPRRKLFGDDNCSLITAMEQVKLEYRLPEITQKVA